jgi:hypothetical protein
MAKQRSKQLTNVPINYSLDNERQTHNAEDGCSSLKKPDNLEQSVNEHNFNLNSQSSKEISQVPGTYSQDSDHANQLNISKDNNSYLRKVHTLGQSVSQPHLNLAGQHRKHISNVPSNDSQDNNLGSHVSADNSHPVRFHNGVVYDVNLENEIKHVPELRQYYALRVT